MKYCPLKVVGLLSNSSRVSGDAAESSSWAQCNTNCALHVGDSEVEICCQLSTAWIEAQLTDMEDALIR